MLKRNNALIIARGLAAGIINCDSVQIGADNTAAINSIVALAGNLPVNPPFEIHPYLNTYIMGEYKKYIIGTFPPISYLIDHPLVVAAVIAALIQPGPGADINPPAIPFYHGNAGDMWKYLLTPAENNILNLTVGRNNKKNYLINFLHVNEINYCDIIKNTQRYLNNAGNYDFTDKCLNNICINQELIYNVLINFKSEYLLFNTGSTVSTPPGGLKIHINANPANPAGSVNVKSNTKSFDLFVRGCQDLGLKVELQIQNGPTPFFRWTEINFVNRVFLQANMHNKVAFEMRISRTEKTVDHNLKDFTGDRIFTVITGPSPSRAAMRGIQKNINFMNWWALHPPPNDASAFITYIYQTFRFGPIAALYALNA
ncbi:MAG TPA: hypothetical protein VIJ27_09100 [Mucilaginibacter sp.]